MMGAEAKNAVCTAVVLAAGRGTRMGISQAKQYLEIGGKPVLAYALEAFQQSPAIDGIVLVTDRDHMEYCRTEIVEPSARFRCMRRAAGSATRASGTP